MSARACHKCGCTDNRACMTENGPCYWVAADVDLCSECYTHEGDIKDIKNLTIKMKKITVPVLPLLAVLKKVKEVVSKHPTLSVLSNVLVKVRRQDIQLIATDTMVTLVAVIEVSNVADYGYDILLPFDFLLSTCSLINTADFTLEILEESKKEGGKKFTVQNAVITTFSDVFDIKDLDKTEEFPTLPEFPAENSVGISGDFVEWLNKSVKTVSADNGRQAMQKIYVEVNNEGLVMATTNAKVLVEKSFQAESAHATTMLVNTKIAKALKGFKETSISWSDTHIAFVSNGITMIGTIQDEKFPDYKRIFPQSEANLKLSLTELKGVMAKAALTNKPATIWLKREIGTVVVDTFDPDRNRKITVRIPADYAGDCDQISILPENLLLLLDQIEYININMAITDPARAILITTESDPSYRSIVMPIVNA